MKFLIFLSLILILLTSCDNHYKDLTNTIHIAVIGEKTKDKFPLITVHDLKNVDRIVTTNLRISYPSYTDQPNIHLTKIMFSKKLDIPYVYYSGPYRSVNDLITLDNLPDYFPFAIQFQSEHCGVISKYITSSLKSTLTPYIFIDLDLCKISYDNYTNR